MATTIYIWLHTDRMTGKRRRTRHRLPEDEARARLIDPEPVPGSEMTVEPAASTPAGHWRSGLVLREDGAMVPTEGR